MDDRIPEELIARIKRFVPKGKVRIEEVPPVRGLTLQPLSAEEVRAAAPREERRKKAA